jgi:hypothetical protein
MSVETMVIWGFLGTLLVVSWFAFRVIKGNDDAMNRAVKDVNERNADSVKARLDPKIFDVVRALNEMQRAGPEKP